MSYDQLNQGLEEASRRFKEDVFDYLRKAGKLERGKTYFGVVAANNPALVSRLESGGNFELPTMLKVWEFMERNPPEYYASKGKRIRGQS